MFLLSPLKHTPWPVIRNVRYNSEEQYHSISTRFQVLFTPCYGYFSAFHHCTAYAIGLKTYLKLEVDASQIPAQFPMSGTQDTHTPFWILFTRLSLSKVPHSKGLQLIQLRLKVSLITPHLPYISIRDSVCFVLLFLADTHSISIDFFSCGY